MGFSCFFRVLLLKTVQTRPDPESWYSMCLQDRHKLCALTLVSPGGPPSTAAVVLCREMETFPTSAQHLHNIWATGCRFQHIGLLLSLPDMLIWHKPRKPQKQIMSHSLRYLKILGGKMQWHSSQRKKCVDNGDWAWIMKRSCHWPND